GRMLVRDGRRRDGDIRLCIHARAGSDRDRTYASASRPFARAHHFQVHVRQNKWRVTMRALGELPMGNRRHSRLFGVALGFTMALAAAGTGCESSSDDDVFDRDDGSLQGELVTYIADNHETGVSQTLYGI